jgi:hypothetical protein
MYQDSTLLVKRGPIPKNAERQKLILKTLKRQESTGLNQLHIKLKNEIPSKDTLYKDLQDLIKEKEVEQDSERKYKISGLSLFEIELELQSIIREEIIKSSYNETNPVELINSLVKWSGIIAVLCALNEIETTRNWTKISSNYVSYEGYLIANLKRYIIKSAIPDDVRPEDMGPEVIRNVLNLWSSDLTEETKTKDRTFELNITKAKNRIYKLKTIFEENYGAELKILKRALVSKS